MIGHSFGAGILFTLTLGQLIQVLSAQTDLPPGSGEGVDSQERVADLIVLINPAIEAIPYDALFTVSNRYRPNTYQPPLLVSITSTGDDATGIAFPVGRAVYTLFERPTSSPLQSEALDHTFGHMGHYITHRLSRGKRAAVCPDWTPPPTDKDAQGDDRPGGNVSDIAFAAAIAAPNKIPESEQARTFFKMSCNLPSGWLRAYWTRCFRGGDYLEVVSPPDEYIDSSNTLIWNIEADKDVIANHGNIANQNLIAFVVQLYGDLAIMNEPRYRFTMSPEKLQQCAVDRAAGPDTKCGESSSRPPETSAYLHLFGGGDPLPCTAAGRMQSF